MVLVNIFFFVVCLIHKSFFFLPLIYLTWLLVLSSILITWVLSKSLHDLLHLMVPYKQSLPEKKKLGTYFLVLHTKDDDTSLFGSLPSQSIIIQCLNSADRKSVV